MDLKKKLLIIILPAALALGIAAIMEMFCLKESSNCGYFFAMIALPIALVWIGLSIFFIMMHEHYANEAKKDGEKLPKKPAYMWFSILMLAAAVILSIIGYEEFLFYEVIIYLIGLLIIKLIYSKREN